MSETDSFIQEVSEEVRQDQMLRYWKKYGPMVIGAVVLVVAGAAYWNYMQSQEQEAAELRGGTFFTAAIGGVEQQVALPEAVDAPAQLLARLTAAAALSQDGQTLQAAERYDAIAAETGLRPEYRDLARLQSIRLRAAEGQTDGALEALGALTGPDAPYRLLAIEMRAALKLQAGDVDGAHDDLRALMNDPLSTPDLAQRARAAFVSSGGVAEDPSG